MNGIKVYRHAKKSGYVWPDTGNGTLGTDINSIFGPRPFSPHITTVGYDYDFHRGIDIPLTPGDTVYSPCNGVIQRLHRTHFGFESDDQLSFWEEDQDGGGSSATFTRSSSNLVITGSRGGAATFPSVAKYKATSDRVNLDTEFEFRVKLGAVGALTAGAFGFAFIDEATNEFIGMEWDGTNVTALGEGTGGAVASNGTTLGVTTETWLRFILDSGTLSWDVSDDAESWTNVDSEAIPAFTSTQKTLVPILYWRSTDSNVSTIEISIDFAGWRDTDTIARFGNWIMLSQDDLKFVILHMQHIEVEVGDIVEAGQVIGKAGNTGFDARSGPVLYPHLHLEYITNTNPLYDNDDPVNPLVAGILPRTDITNNLTVVRSEANDPDAVACWKLNIKVNRADSDLDLNEISLQGSTATRTINFNTRSGLNTDNDVPKESGVYIVPEDFDELSSYYEVSVYFSKAVVGGSFVSANIKDASGNTIWSE